MASWTQEFMPSLNAPHLWDKCENTIPIMAMPECSNYHSDNFCTTVGSNGIHGAECSMTELARFTLSGCESDRYKVGCDPIHVRFGSASLQDESVRLH